MPIWLTVLMIKLYIYFISLTNPAQRLSVGIDLFREMSSLPYKHKIQLFMIKLASVKVPPHMPSLYSKVCMVYTRAACNTSY